MLPFLKTINSIKIVKKTTTQRFDKKYKCNLNKLKKKENLALIYCLNIIKISLKTHKL